MILNSSYLGNMSRTLIFNYLVTEGDNSERLDYVDTRAAPFNLTSLSVSMALNTDVNRCLL